jgi:hypothetical protein
LSVQQADDPELEQEWQAFWEGLDFLLSHLQQEPLFPRTVSTAATKGAQKTVYDLDTLKSYYQGALRQDCKISAYTKYEDLLGKSLLPHTYKPRISLLFVDLDLQSFGQGNEKQQLEELKNALDETLANIKEHFNGATPTVLWTGGVVHIYLTLDADYILVYEDLPEFAPFKDPSVKFMRYAERRLSNGKSDKDHNVSFRSCMLRIPNSMNTKYQGDRSKIIILQRWDGKRARPTKKFMISDFHAYLVQEVVDKKMGELRAHRGFNSPTSTTRPTAVGEVNKNIKPWIEKLLQTAITDYRKHTRDLIIIPYLVVTRGLTDRNQIYDIVMQWADRCDQLRRLEPSRHDFSVKVRTRIDEVIQDRVPPMKVETLKERIHSFIKP